MMLIAYKDIFTLPSVPFYDRSTLPSIAGLYFVVLPELGRRGTLLYIGQSQDIRQRWVNHHRANQMWVDYRIHWIGCGDDAERLQTEAILIRDYRPPWNDKTNEETIRYLTFQLAGARMEIDALRAELRDSQRAYWSVAAELGKQ